MPSGQVDGAAGEIGLLGHVDGLLEAVVLLALVTLAWKSWRRGHDLQQRVAALERQLSERTVSASAPEAPVVTSPVAAEPAASPRWRGLAGFETAIAERWLVWLGGLALALGGLFLAGWASITAGSVPAPGSPPRRAWAWPCRPWPSVRATAARNRSPVRTRCRRRWPWVA
jgi:hypothetical protein